MNPFEVEEANVIPAAAAKVVFAIVTQSTKAAKQAFVQPQQRQQKKHSPQTQRSGPRSGKQLSGERRKQWRRNTKMK